VADGRFPHRFFRGIHNFMKNIIRSEIVLIGPPFAGKSTIGKLLAEQLQLPQISLDELRWQYYREIGFDDDLAQEIRQKGGFLAVVAYWCLFSSHSIDRVLAEHSDCVFDFGGGPIVFQNHMQQAQIKKALAPFTHVIHLLPSPDPDKSIRILRERGSHLQGVNAQGFDWSAFFVRHEQNRLLATHELYTEGKTPTETCAEIISLIQAIN
jgi:shikimate kinase